MFERQRVGRRFGGSANSRHVCHSRDNYCVVACAVEMFWWLEVVVVVVVVERRRGLFGVGSQ
jgi:hypothetical protein